MGQGRKRDWYQGGIDQLLAAVIPTVSDVVCFKKIQSGLIFEA